ncbi:hypothetical protein VI817_008193 [Penicillium citrinum]|nr:hypothetical protein VI817_008193 [Penicillium citrinum]
MGSQRGAGHGPSPSGGPGGHGSRGMILPQQLAPLKFEIQDHIYYHPEWHRLTNSPLERYPFTLGSPGSNRDRSHRVFSQPSQHARPAPEQARADRMRSTALSIVVEQPQIGNELQAWTHLASVSSLNPRLHPTDPDAMEIDTHPPQSLPYSLIQIATAGLTVPNGHHRNNPVYRHTFNIEIESQQPIRLSDVEIIRMARARIRFDRPQPSPMMLDEILNAPRYPARAAPRRLYVRIIIDTFSVDRETALIDADGRLGYMVGMAQDGLGWFPGLPWTHPHFQVRMRTS